MPIGQGPFRGFDLLLDLDPATRKESHDEGGMAIQPMGYASKYDFLPSMLSVHASHTFCTIITNLIEAMRPHSNLLIVCIVFPSSAHLET